MKIDRTEEENAGKQERQEELRLRKLLWNDSPCSNYTSKGGISPNRKLYRHTGQESPAPSAALSSNAQTAIISTRP
jgi:hypothetical protein